MKKQILIIFVSFFLIVQFLSAQWISFDKSTKESKPSVKVIRSDNSGVIIEISLSGVDIREKKFSDRSYYSLSVPEYYTTLEIGKPQLPAIRELIAVPEMNSYKFTIVDSSVITLTGYEINPFQKPTLEGEQEEFTIDESFYQKDTFFPDNIVELDKPGIWRDYRVARLSVFPFRYNPKTKVLKVIQRMVVKIDFENATGDAVIKRKPVSKEWKQMYRNAIINFDYLPVNSQNLNKINSVNVIEDYDYLIITAADYLDAVQALAQWKTRRGFLSKVVSINDIGNNETAIKNYIASEYSNHNIRYVLLAGDISQICWSSTGPGDYNYSLLAGSDYYAEIAIGRISAISITEVNNIIGKGIRYETVPPNDSWVRNALLVAHKEGAPGKYQGCKEEIRTYDYFHDPIFTTAYGASASVGGDEATNADVSLYINSGMGVVNYRGHGSATAWPCWNLSSESYTTSNAFALQNGNKMPIVFSIACSNAKLDYSSAVAGGGFLDGNYINIHPDKIDTSLGTPVDEVGDGIFTTTSESCINVDGITNPRATPHF